MRTQKLLHLCCYTVQGEDMKEGGSFEDAIVIDMDSVKKSGAKTITEYITNIYAEDEERGLKVLFTAPDESLIANLDLFEFFLACRDNPEKIPIVDLPKLEKPEYDPPHMETVNGYTITERVRVKNVEFVLGEKPDGSHFGVWKKIIKSGGYYRMHGFTDRLSALENLHIRALEEVRDMQFLEQKRERDESGKEKPTGRNRG